LQISSFVAGILCLVLSPTTQAQDKQPIDTMTVEEKVGQTMIWTFAGTSFSAQTQEILQRYQLGALIAFSRNIKSTSGVAKFNLEAQKFAARKLKAPLLLMVDQEGGTVTRVRVGTPLPSALALGRMQNAQFVESYAQTNAELLAALGFNVNLAPVMDMSNPSSNSFISNRVFGADAEDVTELSLAYAKGISLGGMIPTAKHFPGHGGMVNDSHVKAAKKIATLEELENKDLMPFMRYANQTYPKALMMAHMALPNIDASGVPATYSSKIIQEVLREKYDYKGLVITDDLEMGGASISPDLGERAVRAFLAGNDMVMLAGHPRNQRRAFEAMVAAVKIGRIPMDRLNQSVARILETKTQIKKPLLRVDEKKSLDIKTKLEALSREIMLKNFKEAIKSKTSQWPTVDGDTRVVVLSSDRRFYAAFKRQFKGKADFRDLSPETIDQAAAEIADDRRSMALFYASGGKTAKWLTQLSPELRAKVIVINCNNPGKIEDPSGFLSVLNINSQSPESGGWVADELNATSDIRTPATAAETLDSTSKDDAL
jgi:beta-N-acetylhexosaminidase